MELIVAENRFFERVWPKKPVHKIKRDVKSERINHYKTIGIEDSIEDDMKDINGFIIFDDIFTLGIQSNSLATILKYFKPGYFKEPKEIVGLFLGKTIS